MAFSPAWGGAIPLVNLGWLEDAKKPGRYRRQRGSGSDRYNIRVAVMPAGAVRQRLASLIGAAGAAYVTSELVKWGIISDVPKVEMEETLRDLEQFLRGERRRRERMIPAPYGRPEPVEYPQDDPDAFGDPIAPWPTDRDEDDEQVLAWFERRYDRRNPARYMRR